MQPPGAQQVWKAAPGAWPSCTALLRQPSAAQCTHEVVIHRSLPASDEDHQVSDQANVVWVMHATARGARGGDRPPGDPLPQQWAAGAQSGESVTSGWKLVGACCHTLARARCRVIRPGWAIHYGTRLAGGSGARPSTKHVQAALSSRCAPSRLRWRRAWLLRCRAVSRVVRLDATLRATSTLHEAGAKGHGGAREHSRLHRRVEAWR